MKTKDTSARMARLGTLLAMMIATLYLAGCATTGYDRHDAAAQSLDETAHNVQAENLALDSALTSLNELVTKPANDLKPQYKRYSDSLDWLVTCARRTDASAAKMSQKHAAYMESWQKEIASINYEAVRTKSEQRKKEVSEGYDALNTRCHEAQTAVQPLISYLQDIRRALSSDLTPGGLGAVKDIVNHAEDTTGKVRTALTNLNTELTAASARMSTVAAQRNPAGAPQSGS